MPGEPAALWTPTRRWMGNLLPMIFAGPLLAWAGWLAVTEPLSPLFWMALAASAIVGWLAVGLLGNTPKRGLHGRLMATFPTEESETKRIMAGFARAGAKGALDPHQHIGFVIFTPSALILAAEGMRVELKRSELMKIETQPNAHTWLGLGGWLRLTGRVSGQPFEVLVEPCGHWTLWACAAERRRLRQLITAWLGMAGRGPS